MTHGRLAIELLNAAEMIVGEIHGMTAVSLGWHDDVDTASTMIRNALDRVQTPDGVLILTDMFGGTPTNIASTFLGQEKVEVVTGVNLPMLIKLAQAQGDQNQDLSSVARMVRESGQSSIYRASDLLAPKNKTWPSGKSSSGTGSDFMLVRRPASFSSPANISASSRFCGTIVEPG